MKLTAKQWLGPIVSSLCVAASACDEGESNADTKASASSKAAKTPPSASADDKAKDCCMGLNECKGKGGCAVPESHACAGQNECRGRGGCRAHCPK